jgi:putative MFS transporter
VRRKLLAARDDSIRNSVASSAIVSGQDSFNQLIPVVEDINPIEHAKVQPPRQRGALLGLFPPLVAREWRVFGIATSAGFFDNYDTALISLALVQIQIGLGVAESDLGKMLSIIRLGYLPALLIAPLSDIFGRRRLLMHTVVGYTLFTALTAFAIGPRTFVASQFMARAFAGAEGVIALVIIAEEVRAEVRGWMIGLMGALIAAGYGVAALAFAFIHVIPYGWRGIYLLALVPLGVVIPLRRLLPESRRFEQIMPTLAAVPASPLGPLRELFRFSPTRLAMVFSVTFLIALGNNPGSYLYAKYLQEVHHWTPGQVSSMVILGGAIGIVGNIVAGRLSDNFGRRLMGAIFTMLGPIFTIWMFTTASSESVVFAWVLRLFVDTASATIVSAYQAELFPTTHRAAAGSLMIVAATIGGALGLTLEGMLYPILRTHWSAICYLTGFWMIAPFIILLWFPETAGRELEAISPHAGAFTL